MPLSDGSKNKSAQARNYLKGYARNMFRLNIYWSDPFTFSLEFRERFNSFKKIICNELMVQSFRG
jgi:hypothetical protein